MPARLREVAGAIDMSPSEVDMYIHRVTGEIVMVEDSVLAAIRKKKTPRPSALPEESVEDARRVAAEKDAFVQLPAQQSYDGYRLMEDFCGTVEDARIRERLEDAIRGKGAFRRFKDMVRRTGVEQDWYAFRNAAILEVARAFLEEHEIPYEA
ncbi:MAG: UPF0158 family protein [Hyphomicrobiaceae bacterium]